MTTMRYWAAMAIVLAATAAAPLAANAITSANAPSFRFFDLCTVAPFEFGSASRSPFPHHSTTRGETDAGEPVAKLRVTLIASASSNSLRVARSTDPNAFKSTVIRSNR